MRIKKIGAESRADFSELHHLITPAVLSPLNHIMGNQKQWIDQDDWIFLKKYICSYFSLSSNSFLRAVRWASCRWRLLAVVGWKGSYVLLQALELPVNLSSETLANEVLEIAEMLKKRSVMEEWGCNTLNSVSNTRKGTFSLYFCKKKQQPQNKKTLIFLLPVILNLL